MKFASFVFVICITATASDAFVSAADQTADRASIEKSVESYTTAFNARDAKSLADHWSAGAIYVNPNSGVEVQGREAIAKEFESILSGLENTKLVVEIESIEFVSPQVAVENGVTTLVTKPVSGADSTETSTYSAVHIKQDGKWLLDRVTEKDVPVAQSNYDQLKELQWLIGRWVDRDGDTEIETIFQWTRNRNFITRFFEVRMKGQADMSGMQIIGWDAARKQIRSWTFDSDGGHAMGFWIKKDDRWSITSANTLPDGGKASSVNIITKVDDDQFKWRSVNRMANGDLLPNIDEVVVVRAD